MRNDTIGLALTAIALLAFGILLVMCPQKAQEWQLKGLRGRSGYLARRSAKQWESHAMTWILRAVGVLFTLAGLIGLITLVQRAFSLG